MSLKCTECEYMFFHAHQLEKHKTFHDTKRIKQCNTLMFTSSTAINREYTISHTEQNMFALPTARPLTEGSGEKPYKCNQCDYSPSRAEYLRKHMKVHSEARPYKCNQCDSAFKRTAHLTRHMKVHSGEKTYKFECDLCDDQASQLTLFKSHIRTIHENLSNV